MHGQNDCTKSLQGDINTTNLFINGANNEITQEVNIHTRGDAAQSLVTEHRITHTRRHTQTHTHTI